MIRLHGIPVSGGIAVGRARRYVRDAAIIPRYAPTDVEAEVARFLKARDRAASELLAIHDQAGERLKDEDAEIFQAGAMMLEDGDFCDCAIGKIRSEKVNAGQGVQEAASEFSEMLSSTGDEYIAGRASDVMDICQRVISILSCSGRGIPQIDSPVILVADDLLPSETVQLDRRMILAVVTAHGTAISHTAILARSMDIPSVAGLGDGAARISSGTRLIVDGSAGDVYVDPDPQTLELFTGRAQHQAGDREDLRSLVGLENRTRSGRRVDVYANVGTREDIELALANDAGGIGLFRSEVAYLGRGDYPTEDELFALYRDAALMMGDRRVIIRTLDIGGDKEAPYMCLEKEENPALGLRGIRLCFARPEIFRTQLRAIMRAAAFGNIAVMFPMITAAEELDRIEEVMAQVRKELADSKEAFKEDIEVGIMVETPAAALMSDVLAGKCRFFSIGSNDLSQYTLAADRQGQALKGLGGARSEAVLRLIEMTVKNGHAGGIRVGICGELGADLKMTSRLLAMGIDEFSVAPAAVLPLRKRIRDAD